MPWAIVIPADETAVLEFRLFNDYRDYQEAVGGTFQTIDIPSPDSSIICNDEGKIMRLPLNRRASLLLWLYHHAFRGQDAIMGDAVVVGGVDDEGETQDVPTELVDLLLKTDIYRYEVQTLDGGDKWHRNQVTYDSFFDATNGALALLERWTLASDVRVVPFRS